MNRNLINQPTLAPTRKIAYGGSVGMALGVIVLCWTSWLYLRKRPCETAAIPGLIIIALAIPLAFMIGGMSGDTAGVKELGRGILHSFPVMTTPTPAYRAVNAVLYSDNKPSAIFGDEVVHEGDTIHGIKIVRIYKDGIELEKHGQRWTQAVERGQATY